ncbi:MAG: hypothetical protein GY928_16540 [Colwellia sp.]|nr:hypothetical protein [Colwellia sp.]
MKKVRYMLIGLQVIISLVGCYLIGDIKIICGVIMFLWANNFNFVKKDKIEDGV